MPRTSNVVFLRLGDLLPADLVDRLTDRGFRVTSLEHLSEALPGWAQFEDPTLLIDAGADPSVVERILKTLIEHRRFLNCPIIMATADPRPVHKVLCRFFSIALTVAPPCNVEDVFHRLDAVERCRVRLGQNARMVAPEDGNEPTQSAEGLSGSLTNGLTAVSLADESGPRFGEVFGAVTGANLDFQRLDTSVVTRPYTLREMCDGGICQLGEAELERGRLFLNQLDRLGRRQVLRTVALVGSLSKALRCTREEQRSGTLGALFYGLGFAAKDPDVLRGDYRRQRHHELRTKLVRGLEESGTRIAEDLGRQDVASMIRCFGDIIARRLPHEADPAAMRLATLIYGSELLGRVCFLGGWWNPWGAYGLLSRLQEGTVRDLPPVIAAALVHLVAAAVSECPRGFLVPKELRHDTQLLSRARAWRDLVLDAGERKVALVDLLPGMRLGRQIETFDGALLLESESVLDGDLIWRLWRLAAIRPLNLPVVVVSEEARRVATTDDDSLGAEIDAILEACRDAEPFLIDLSPSEENQPSPLP